MDRHNPKRNRKYPPRRFPGNYSKEIKGIIYCQGIWFWLSEYDLLLLNWFDEMGKELSIEQIREKCSLEKISTNDILGAVWRLIDAFGQKMIGYPRDGKIRKITKAKQRSLKENEYSRREDW